MSKKWLLSIPYYAVVYGRVEADTKEEAIKLAEENVWPALCLSCSQEVIIGDPITDGDIEAEELEDDDDDSFNY